MIPLFDATQPPEVYKAIEDVVKSGVFVKGPKVEELEQKWAEICGMKYAIGVSSGATALELAIKSVFSSWHLDWIGYTDWTYKAVPNAIKRMGFTPKPQKGLAQIWAHHHHEESIPGYAADVPFTPHLEDCSHVHGYKPVADTAIFSFYPTKILGAVGDAGIIVTNREDVNELCRHLRNHGEPEGTNARMDEIQAAALLAKLPYLDQWISRRQEIVNLYDDCLGRFTKGKYHYVYCIEGSKEKAEKLKKMGVETAFYYTEKEMALPLYPSLTDEQVKEVISCVLQL